MKKFFSFIIMAVACLAFAGCGSGSSVEFDNNRKMNLKDIYVEDYKVSNYLSHYETSINIDTNTIYSSSRLKNDTVILTLKSTDSADMTPYSLANELGEIFLTDCASATIISNTDFFRITLLVGDVTKYGVYDAIKKAYLYEPTENDYVYNSNLKIVLNDGKYYNLLNDGALINSSSVGEKTFSFNELESSDYKFSYIDGFIFSYLDSSNNLFFKYYDKNYQYIDEFRIFKDSNSEFFYLVNGDILEQTSVEVSKNDDYTVFSGDNYIKLTHKIYSAKTGDVKEIYLPYYVIEIESINNDEYKNIKDKNIVCAAPIIDRQMETEFAMLFNDNLSSLLHVYDTSPFICRVNDELYFDEEYFLNENGEILNGYENSYSRLDCLYTMFSSNEEKLGFKDYKGKITISPVYDSILGHYKGNVLIQKTVNEVECLYLINVATGAETLISNNYTNLAVGEKYFRYFDVAAGNIIFKGYNNETLLSFADGSTVYTNIFSGSIYVYATTGGVLKIHLLK